MEPLLHFASLSVRDYCEIGKAAYRDREARQDGSPLVGVVKRLSVKAVTLPSGKKRLLWKRTFSNSIFFTLGVLPVPQF